MVQMGYMKKYEHIPIKDGSSDVFQERFGGIIQG
jgi:hypothetical protein